MYSLRLFVGLVGFFLQPFFFLYWVSSCILFVYRGKPSLYPFVSNICSVFIGKKLL